MIKDLRDYLAFLNNEGWLDHIGRQVELLEIPSLLKEQESKGNAVVFDNIKGYDYPIVNNLFGRRDFLARLFNCEIKDVPRVFSEKYTGRVKPVMVNDAPVHDIIFRDSQIDIQKFPFLTHALKDAGRFITAGMVIAKDPETGVRNSSFNRMQLKGPNKTGFRMSPTQDLEYYYKKATRLNQPLEIAACIGNHPLDQLASTCGVARDVDELDIAGSLRGEPVELVKCVSVDLEVPAHAELVLEGYILPNEMEEEGPFADFLEFYIPVMKNHVFHITAVTMRSNPIIQVITPGSKDDVTLLATPREGQLYKILHDNNVDVQSINLAVCNNYLTGAVSIKKNLEYEPTNIMLATFGSFKFLKIFFVVDHDVNIFDPKDIFWALSTRLRCEKGVMVIPNAVGFGRDEYGVYSAKLGVDATVPIDSWDYFERATVLISA